MMKTLNLKQAAEFLQCHPETLRQKAKAGLVPCSKFCGSWLFVDVHLAEFISYASHRQGEQVIDKQELKKCQSINVVKLGGFSSQTQTEKEYNNLLGLK